MPCVFRIHMEVVIEALISGYQGNMYDDTVNDKTFQSENFCSSSKIFIM